MGRLAAGVAHELGSPLSVIDGKAQRVLRDDELGEAHRRALLQIRQQVARLSAIVRQLLDFGRAAGSPPRRVPAEVLAHSAAAAVADELAALEVRLQLQAPPQTLHCRVDPPRFEQALTNLLRNAARASPGGEVRLSWWGDGRELFMQVEDDGPALPKAIAERCSSRSSPPRRWAKAAAWPGCGPWGGQRVRRAYRAGRGRLPGAAFRIALPLSEEENHD